MRVEDLTAVKVSSLVLWFMEPSGPLGRHTILEDREIIFLRNIIYLQFHVALQPRRRH
jgi:hypothetical protein